MTVRFTALAQPRFALPRQRELTSVREVLGERPFGDGRIVTVSEARGG